MPPQTSHTGKCPRNTRERSLTSLVIREVQIKVGYWLSFIKLMTMNNKNNTINFEAQVGTQALMGMGVCVCVLVQLSG